MAITSLKRDFVDSPNIVRMETTNTLAEVETDGYLATQVDIIADINSGTWTWLPSDLVLCYASDGLQLFTLNADLDDFVVYSTAGNGAVTLPVVSGNFTVFDGTLGALQDLGYLPSDATKTNVVMAGSAVVANRFAKFVDTAGTIDDTAGAATNLGNILAGASGTAGTLTSFPATAANGSLILAAINAGGAFNTTISNSVMGQSSVISIPDPGVATANFLLSASAGTQSITAGNLSVAGSITSVAGNITSGSSGDAGTFISFPGTAANGTLILAAVNAGAAFNTTISNGAMGQSTVYTIGDIGAATGGIPVSTGAIRMKMVADAAVAGGSATQNVVDAFCTAASVVLAIWQTQANPAVIQTVVPGAGSFDVISDADAGAGTLNYVIFK